MKKLFLRSTLVLALVASCLGAPAPAGSVTSDIAQKSPTVSVSKTTPKATAKANVEIKTKTDTRASNIKANTISKIQTKTTVKTEKQTKPNAKKSSTKSGSASVTKPKTTSRGSSFDVSRILSLGMSLKGTPYKYGGGSPKGFDCSGFTSYVFRNAAGISLPRTSRGQASAGVRVDKADLQTGDLVYFNTSGSGISHVGIYTGGGNFIHASRTKGITVTSLNDSYYKPRYLGAARVR